MAHEDSSGSAGLSWDFRLPILTNVFLWYDLAKVFLIVYVIVVALLGTIFWLSDDGQTVVAMMKVFAVVCGSLCAVSVPIAAVWYANRAHVRFELTPKGVTYRTLEAKDKAVNRMLFVLGVLAGRPGAAGAGLVAASRETEFTRWSDVTRIKEHPAYATISLIGGWRVVQRLSCSREDYERVVAYVGIRVRRSWSVLKRRLLITGRAPCTSDTR